MQIQTNEKYTDTDRKLFSSYCAFCVGAPLHVVLCDYHHNTDTEFDGELCKFVTQIQIEIEKCGN